MKKFLFLFVTLMIPFLGWGQFRSEKEAISVANSFWGVSSKTLSVVPDNTISKAKSRAKAKQSNGKSSYYIINDEANNRFVIVSSDERLYEILGYSDNGVFDAESAPLGLIDMLASYDQQYENIEAQLTTLSAKAPQRSLVTTPVKPLLSSKWDQDSPFNDECPNDIKSSTNKNCVTGCVATAMAQVMYYYKYPQSGEGANSYNSESRNIYQSMDFSKFTPDWNNMIDIYDDNATKEQKEAIAKLMHACGISVSMDYANVSGAYPGDIAYSLSHFWKYSPSVSYKLKKFYNDNEWNEIIISELTKGHPVLYGGQSEYLGGHRFVLDGVDDEGFYHFNFGWSGSSDGYYTLDILGPNILYDFSNDQSMVCYIRPETNGYSTPEFGSPGFLNLKTCNVGDVKVTSVNIYNYNSDNATNISSAEVFKGEVGVGVFDKDFNFIKSFAKKDVTLKNSYYISLYPVIQFDNKTFKDGSQYYIARYVYSNDKGYSIVRSEKGQEDYILATVKGTTVTFDPMKKMDDTDLETGEVLTGLYNGQALNNMGSSESWQIELWQDNEDPNKYWIANLDPEVKSLGYSYNKGFNKVYGYISANGKRIDIPAGQIIGENILLRNFSSSGDIRLYLDSENKKASIDDIWGSVQVDQDNENSPLKEIARYSNTKFEYTTLREEEGDGNNISNPIIEVSSDHLLTIRCSVEDAQIYYTLDGTQPSASSTIFSQPVELKENCTINAFAVKGDKKSGVSSFIVSDFTCASPIITQNENSISITSLTPNATIYYTLDGSTPTKNSKKYDDSFEIEKSCVVKAIAMRSNYNDSPIVTKSLIYSSEDVEITEVVVIDNEAGKLSSNVSVSDKQNATRWTISGNLNGDDIIYLHEVFKIGKITDLDLGNASIVAGGSSYYKIASLEYYTEDDILGSYMFEDAESLISLILPASTVKINSYSLQDCKSLSELVIPDNCVTVDKYAISNARLLTNIHLGKNVASFEQGNGNLCRSLESITVSPLNTNFKSKDGILYNYDYTTIVKYPSGKIEKSFTLPSSVITVGPYSLCDAAFEEVILPESVKYIETSAFSDCKNLNSIDIPQTVESIGMFAFQNCSSLQSVVIPDKVTKLPSFSFGSCVSLRECHLGAAVKDIEGTAFNKTISLQSFTVSEQNQNFASSEGILFSKDMTSIVRCPIALYSNELLIDDNVKVIESNAFADCVNILKFKLPENLKEIGSSAFSNCQMEQIAIPANVEKIGMFGFQDCSNLKSFTIPKAVTSIPLYMLSGCEEMTYLYIPEGITAIDGYAFSKCKNLETIESWISDWSMIDIKPGYSGDYTSFSGISKDCTWHVPLGCATEYKSQPWWVSSWKIVEDLNTGIFKSIINNELSVVVGSGNIIITSSIDTEVSIYNVNGHKIKSVVCYEGYPSSINLESGIYIINGQKYFVK